MEPGTCEKSNESKKNDEISSGSEEEENIQNKTKNDDVLDQRPEISSLVDMMREEKRKLSEAKNWFEIMRDSDDDSEMR